jgi:hypothetical protein
MKYNSMCFRLALTAVMVIGFAATGPVWAGSITITGGAASVAPGDTGTVDFSISADPGVNLAIFDLHLVINVVTGNPIPFADLSFSATQPAVFDNLKYVFFGNSFLQDSGADSIWTTPPDNTSIFGLDINDANTGPGYTTLSTSPVLLATVKFALNADAPLDSVFTISVADGTDFFDETGNPLTDFTSMPATITVAATAATPEPASLTLLGIGGVGMAAFGYRHRRKSASASAQAVQ